MVVATVDSLFRLTARDGKVVRRARVARSDRVALDRAPAALLVAGTTDSLVVAIDPDDLRPRWRAALDAPVLGTPAARATPSTPRAGGERSIASRRRLRRRRRPAVAELDWPVTSPVTVLDGLVLLGGADGTLRALRPDGTEAWRLQLRWPVELGPLPLDDGLLAVGGDGDLHRYRR